jgi:hypothetical protein
MAKDVVAVGVEFERAELSVLSQDADVSPGNQTDDPLPPP